MRGAFVLSALIASVAHAGEEARRVRFDPALLRGSRGTVDLSAFERGAAIAPGDLEVDVVRNGVPMGRRRVRFDAEGPCVDHAFAAWMEVAIARLSPAARDALAACVPIAMLHPAAQATFDAGALVLHVSVPQALLRRHDEGVDHDAFDAGIPALRFNHAVNVVQAARDTRHATLHLDAGANLGAWRWRHRGMHAWSPGTHRSEVLASMLERDVGRFDARLTIGDFHASGMSFDPIALRGVRFQSDDRMSPAGTTHRGPVVRGTADTHARVQVRQAGALIFDAPVPPGPFALEDVRPLARGGVLEVRIVEADGRVRTFDVPWAAMPGLLRAGRARFGLAAGVLRSHRRVADAPTFQGSVHRGLHDRLTMHGGAQLAPDYAQAIAGAVFSTRVGAFALERSHSRSTLPLERAIGESTRASFTTQFLPTRTQVDIGAWRRTHGAWRSLDDVMRARHAPTDRPMRRERERIEASIRQAFGARGHTLRLSMVDRRFDPGDGARSLQLAYAPPALRGGAQLHALVERAPVGHAGDARPAESTHAMLSLSVPLQSPGSDAPMFLQAHARGGPGRFALQSGIGGAFGRDARNAWRVGLSHAESTLASASLGHAGRAGHLVAGWSGGEQHRQWSLSGEGSMVLHAHGLTFGPSLGETAALVRAPDGSGARVLDVAQARLDRKGFALVPHLTPYLRNRVGIDPNGAAHGVAFDWTERDVFPRAGALVAVAVPTRRASTRFVRIVDAAGAPAPFGARIVDAHGTPRGQVGRDGLTLLDAIERSTTSLTIEWQDGDDLRRCTFALPDDMHGHTPGDIPALACHGESDG